MVAACTTRLAMAGFSDRPSGIDFSADSDFTTWGTGSLGTSAVQLTINAPGAKITLIAYAFGRLMWFKNSSFGFILIGNQPLQTDWVIRTVSYDVGTNDNSFVYREGILYFRGQDGHIYAFDGSSYQRASRDIAGTIATEQNKTQGSWAQTTQADFQAGAQSPSGWISTSNASGVVSLSTQSTTSIFINSVSTDFAAGTITNVSTITANTLRLSLGIQNILASQNIGTDGEVCASECTGSYYQSQALNFSAISSSSILSSISLNLQKVGSPGDFTLYIKSDGGGIPGTTLESIPVTAASVSTSSGIITVNFSSTTKLSGGTTYFAQLIPNSTCDASNKIIWRGQSGVGATLANGCGSSATSSFLRYQYKVYVTSYVASGTFVSKVFDDGFPVTSWVPEWGIFNSSTVVPTGTTLNFYVQTSSSATGIFSATSSAVSGSQLSTYAQEFIRFGANFTTVDGSTSPVLSTSTISILALLRPGATYFSQIKNTPNITSWDTFNAGVNNGGGTHTFSIRSATNSFTVTSSTPSWSTVTNGGIPTVSTGIYFQIKDQLDISSSSIVTGVGPYLSDFSQNWFEGSAADKAYATYFDDKIWWEVTAGTGATTNNKTLVYDLLNQTWTIYDLAANGFFVRQNRLYFGSSSAGYIYKYGDTDNDNGSAINAYWRSKDFFGDDPFSTQEIANISVVGKSVSNSSMTVICFINGTSSSTYTMPLYSSLSNFTGKNKNLTAGTVGNTYSVKFGNNAADQPFEVFGIQIGIRQKSWIPTP